MKKQFLAIAACLLIFTACSNDNTPSQGEKDDEYMRTFENHGEGKKDGHNKPATEHSKDKTDSKEGKTDTTHLPHGEGTGQKHENKEQH
jgi:hypothetical protein